MIVAMGVRYFEPRGGQEKFALRLARFLAGHGHWVRVHAFAGQPMDGVELRLLPKPAWCARAWRDWATGRALAAALREEAAGVVTWGEQKVWDAQVVRPGGGSEEAYWRAHAAFRRPDGRGAEWLRYLHLKRLFDLDAERRAYASPRLRQVIVNARLVQEQLLRDHPGLRGRITVVHNGWEADDAPPAAARPAGAPHAVTALFAGHDFARKGLRHALGAVAEAARRDPAGDLRLIVAGRGRATPYRRLAARLGIADRVRFAAGEELSALYAAADVLLLPTHFDPFANVTVEALAAGVPVITTAANGGCEILHDGVDGWVLGRPDDTRRMADILLSLADPARRRAAATAARATAQDHRLDARLAEIEEILLATAAGP